jgi:N-methylhydantoinase B
LVDCRTIVTADRVRLGCYGLNGGKAGQPFCVTVDAEGEGFDLGGLVDGEPVLKGQVVRVVTTGGGGWGDPLQRELELVWRDVVEGRVSATSAEADYGVVFKDSHDPGQPEIDEAATKQRRAEMGKVRNAATGMIDRGEGYEKMLRGEHRPRMR